MRVPILFSHCAPGAEWINGHVADKAIVHNFRLEEWRRHLPEFYAQLSDSERQRAGDFVHSRARALYILTHGLLRRILGDILDRPAAELRFTTGTYGKPVLAGTTDGVGLCFSLSHSVDTGAVAVTADRRIGVDIERHRLLPDMESLARIAFSSTQAQTLAALPRQKRLASFFSWWTKQEAVLKGLGTGLADFPHNSPIFYGDQSETAETNDVFWHVRCARPFTATVCSVAVELPSSSRRSLAPLPHEPRRNSAVSNKKGVQHGYTPPHTRV